MKIVSLRQTCQSHPAQWSAQVEDGRWLYIRYRWGILSMSWATPNADNPTVLDRIATIVHSDGYDGEMEEAEMREPLGLVDA
jgi:hypothetical protein